MTLYDIRIIPVDQWEPWTESCGAPKKLEQAERVQNYIDWSDPA